MDDREKTAIERDVYVSLRDYLQALRIEDQRRLDERFAAQEKANQLKADELQRRLEVLNHAHEQARQKEADFISREVFDNHVERNLNDHMNQRQDTAQSAKVLADKVEASAIALAEKVEASAAALVHSQNESQKNVNSRLSALENFQAKLLGLALAAPFVSALAVYLITR